jgi:membrane-bound lytic murein transglycosylase A
MRASWLVLVAGCYSANAGSGAGSGAGSAVAAAGSAAQCPCDDSHTDPSVQAPPHDELTLTKAKFTDLPGWADDKQSEALPSFLNSCARLAKLADTDPIGVDGHGGTAKQWRHACAAAAKVTAGDDKAARAFFESEFVAWQAAGKSGVDGKLTGYCVQQLHASRKKAGKFQIPILARPKDLAEIKLDDFVADGHGRRIWGRFDSTNGKVLPYPTRVEIRKGALASQKLELMYADDPVDVLFAQIEGSGKALMDDGTTVWLNFDGKNGRAYKGVGKALKDLNLLVAPYNGTMPGIRKWFVDHPKRFDEIVDLNASYVFFEESKEAGATGSQDVLLTPRRSAAIDRAFIAHSTPIWVDGRKPEIGKTGTVPYRSLLIAQDTGGGILGAVRADIYWGDDKDAEELAGRMGGPGKYWLLLPKGVTK